MCAAGGRWQHCLTETSGGIVTVVTKPPRGGGGGDLVLSLPGCVCPKVKDMGPFWASRE